MQDLLWQLKDTNSFALYTSAALTAAVFWFIREIVDAPVLALVSTPILMASGIVAPIVFRTEMIVLAYDEQTNLVATIAVGILTALVLIVALNWLWALILEHQTRRTRLAPVVSRSRPRR